MILNSDILLLDPDNISDEEQDFNSEEKNGDKEYQIEANLEKSPKKVVQWDRKIQIAEIASKHKWDWQNFKKKGFKEITSKRVLFRIKSQVKRGINRANMIQKINKHVFKRVQKARESFKILRASHLRSFAMQKYLKIAYPKPEFKASSMWMKNFRKSHKIASRKITRLVSKREVKSEKEILDAAEKFQKEIREISKHFDDDHVLNTDQCGFQYELTSQRTLTTKGEKSVFGYAQSPNNLSTHSYTVQYIINKAGKIVGNVFVCLQEPNGKFGANVQRDIDSYIPPNLTLTCSKSGKMSTYLNDHFIQKQIVPNVKKPFLLIVDSWPGHNKIEPYQKYFQADRQLTFKVIPEKCTPLAQPLDTTFHRQLKILAREILAGLELYVNEEGVNSADNWTNRHGVIKLHSLLHFFLSAPIFEEMIKYSWYSSKLTEEKNAFLNVKEVCFIFADCDSKFCEMRDCLKQRFIKCSLCRKCLCIHHLWLENHFNFCESSNIKY